MNNDDIDKLLNHVYYENKSFDSINELHRKAKLVN